MTVLETQRLSLRHLTLEDAPFILELLNEPAYLKNIGDRGVRTVDDASKYLSEKLIECYGRLGFGLYLVELKTTKTAVGICGLVKRETLKDIDIGFAFLSKFWGQGYATESAQGILEYARDHLEIKRLAGITAPDNFSSGKVLEKIGLRLEGMVKLNKEGPESKFFVVDFKK